jgi:hypothetical protein
VSVPVKDLVTVLSIVRERIGKWRGQPIGEENTKTVLIEPILRALGWDIEDLDEVRKEYRHKPGDNPVDYALLILRTPRLFVEAKALGENLADRRWGGQIMGYAAVAGVEWVVLTDGNEYRIYNANANADYTQKLFRQIVIDADEQGARDTLTLLSKSQLQDNQIDALWKSDFVDRQVRDALDKLFGPEPEVGLVHLVRSRASRLSPAEVRASLGRLRATFDFPVAVPGLAAKEAPAPREASAGTPWRNVTLAEIIGAGLIRVPLEIEHRFRGVQLVARIEDADHISFGGSVYESLSVAAGMARKSVRGAPAGRKYPQTNGWTSWQYRRADDTLSFLDELRRAFYEDKLVRLAATRRIGA